MSYHYSYSHVKDRGWIGAFERPSDCLIAARAMYGAEGNIYIARCKTATYADIFIGADVLLSYMRESAEAKGIDTDCFESLTPTNISTLNQWLTDLIGEFEAELPAESLMTGVWVDSLRLYGPSAEVRPGHFPP